MMNLPYEMIDHIIYFVEDKIGVSMVCKIFNKIVFDMHKHKRLNNFNDTYYLKDICLNDNCIKNNIHHIHNHNCFNLIVYKLLHNHCYEELRQEILLFVLQRIFILNNNPNPQLIKKLSGSLNNSVIYGISRIDVLIQVFAHDAYDILKIVIINCPILKTYLGQSLLEYHVHETNINVIINTIKNLTKRHIITFFDLYSQIRKLDDRIADKYDILMWDELYDYLEENISENALKYFK